MRKTTRKICSSVFDRKRKDLIGFAFFYRLENEWIEDESEKLFARFITLLGDLTYAGYNEVKLGTRPETIVDIPNFTLPQPKKTGRKIFFFVFVSIEITNR